MIFWDKNHSCMGSSKESSLSLYDCITYFPLGTHIITRNSNVSVGQGRWGTQSEEIKGSSSSAGICEAHSSYVGYAEIACQLVQDPWDKG